MKEGEKSRCLSVLNLELELAVWCSARCNRCEGIDGFNSDNDTVLRDFVYLAIAVILQSGGALSTFCLCEDEEEYENCE